MNDTLMDLIVRDFKGGDTLADIAEARGLSYVQVERAVRRHLLRVTHAAA